MRLNPTILTNYEEIWWEITLKTLTVNKIKALKLDFDFWLKQDLFLWMFWVNYSLCNLYQPETTTLKCYNTLDHSKPNTPLRLTDLWFSRQKGARAYESDPQQLIMIRETNLDTWTQNAIMKTQVYHLN